MTSISWVFRRYWHPQHVRLARVRALWWILARRHETEICGRCGGPVGLVWHAPDSLWCERSGYPTDGGVLCVRCFDMVAGGLWWECADRVFPSCTGSPCAHEETMLILSEQCGEIWREFETMRHERDKWWDKYFTATAPAIGNRAGVRT